MVMDDEEAAAAKTDAASIYSNDEDGHTAQFLSGDKKSSLCV